jgi:hypothetical protein
MITLSTARDGDSTWTVNERAITVGRIHYVRGRYEVSVSVPGDDVLWFATFPEALNYVNEYVEVLKAINPDDFRDTQAV